MGEETMRPIEFRQWDILNKRMLYGFGGRDGGVWFPPQYKWDMYPVMQFTGLLDLNQKKIFEGDIVRQYYCGYQGEFDSGNKLGVVEFGDACFWISRMHPSPVSVSGKILEVIGNIWENGDLLK